MHKQKPYNKNHYTMKIKLPISMITLIFFTCLPFTFCSSHNRLECIKIPPPQFAHSLKSVIDKFHDLTSVLHFELSNVDGFADIHLPNAISLCLELVDISVEELNWCVAALESPKGKSYGTSKLSSDLRTWLSAIHANTDTCMDGLEETSATIKDKVSIKIAEVDSLVNDLLNNVEVQTISAHNKGPFPSWVKPSVQKLVRKKAKQVFDVVVAADGTGNFTKIMDAVTAAPDSSVKHYVILIKKGVYREYVEVNKSNIMMIGEGMDATFITGNLSNATNHLGTYKTATFGVQGSGFIARDISFWNTAGPSGYQAVALRSNSDQSVFYRCGIFGYQDSLYAFALRQFYRECKISGTVDFIFGSAIAVFQNCTILVKKGLPRQSNTITAQGGKHDRISTGFSFQYCNISADFDLLPSIKSISTFLGRPWKPYSTTVFMQSYIGDLVRPEGWLEWSGSPQNLDTLYYAEYENYGPGAGTKDRVKWQHYHVLNDSSQAIKFTVAQFIMGNLWLRSTGVPFTPGLGDHS